MICHQLDIPQITNTALPARLTDNKEPKGLDIKLWHARLGHLGMQNVCKIAEITKGIRISNLNTQGKKICEACELAKPLRHTRKVVTKRVFDAFEKVHMDMFKITLVGYNRHKYRIIYTDKATHAR